MIDRVKSAGLISIYTELLERGFQRNWSAWHMTPPELIKSEGFFDRKEYEMESFFDQPSQDRIGGERAMQRTAVHSDFISKLLSSLKDQKTETEMMSSLSQEQKSALGNESNEKISFNAAQADPAMTVTKETETPGGIDLNPNKMDLQTKGEDAPLYAPVDPAVLENMINIDGAYSVIINVTPVLNLPLLLGIKDLSREESLSYAK